MIVEHDKESNFMKKFWYRMIWALIFLGINLCALPVSIYSLFAIEKGTNITRIDYSLAILILIVSNLITLQLFFAIKMNQKQNTLFGILIACIQIIAFILFMNLYEKTGITIFSISVIASVIMVMNTWRHKNPALM